MQRWRDAGAMVEGDRVRLPKGLCAQARVDRALIFRAGGAQTPSATSRSAAGSWCSPRSTALPFVRDYEGGRRYGTIADFRNFVRLGYMSKWVGTILRRHALRAHRRRRQQAAFDMLLAHMTLFRTSPSWAR